MPRLKDQELVNKPSGENSAAIRARVECAHQIQRQRFANDGIYYNAHMNAKTMLDLLGMNLPPLQADLPLGDTRR